METQSGRGTRNAEKPLRGFQGCDKNDLNESFKMSPHLTCLKRGINFHIISRPDPEAGHKIYLRCQLRHIKWGLILMLLFRPFLAHHPESLRIFFSFHVSLRCGALSDFSMHSSWIQTCVCASVSQQKEPVRFQSVPTCFSQQP